MPCKLDVRDTESCNMRNTPTGRIDCAKCFFFNKEMPKMNEPDVLAGLERKRKQVTSLETENYKDTREFDKVEGTMFITCPLCNRILEAKRIDRGGFKTIEYPKCECGGM